MRKDKEVPIKDLLGGLKPASDSLRVELLPSIEEKEKSPVAAAASEVDAKAEQDYIRMVNRKVSINEQNVIGTNFERYNREEKPS